MTTPFDNETPRHLQLVCTEYLADQIHPNDTDIAQLEATITDEDLADGKAQWIGAVGLELPSFLAIHPTLDPEILDNIHQDSFVYTVDRHDGNFGFYWGFEAIDPRSARRNIRETAQFIGSKIGALSTLEASLYYNKQLALDKAGTIEERVAKIKPQLATVTSFPTGKQ